MFRYVRSRSVGQVQLMNRFDYITLFLNKRKVRHYSLAVYGKRAPFWAVWAFYWQHCSHCPYVHHRLGAHFFRDILLADDLPVRDVIAICDPLLKIMLLFSAIRCYFGKNALLKSCDFILRNHERLYALLYWGSEVMFGLSNYLAMEHYFREALDIQYVQKIEQWANCDDVISE